MNGFERACSISIVNFFFAVSCSAAPTETPFDLERHRTEIQAAFETVRESRISNKEPRPIGIRGPETVGPQGEPKRVANLLISEPGVYENYLIDGGWSAQRLVRIKSEGVVLRNCEIRNATRNAVEVYANDVIIENCHIHHVLKGSYAEQDDAHGITGCPQRLIIRNCDIHHTSGDAIQFDPDRGEWTDVLIEGCNLWTGPLDADVADFRRGERPGENGLDTKASPKHPRSRVVVRDCLIAGWGEGQISNQAGLNLKENIDALVANCVFAENEIAFRVRGDAGRGNADVTIRDCAVYSTKVAVRAEDRISNFQIESLGIAEDVVEDIYIDRGKIGPGFQKGRIFRPDPMAAVLRSGIDSATSR